MTVTLATQTSLDVHGLRISVEGDWPEVLEAIRLDFAWFETTPTALPAPVVASVERRVPESGALAHLPRAFVTPRGTVYLDGDRMIVDHLGKATSVIDHGGDRCVVQGEDGGAVHDAAYYFVLGRVGEHLDAVGLYRLHALGLVGAQGAVAVLLPAEGGKSTLALRALREDGVGILSEDSPLIDRAGTLHPFPLRIGINAKDAHSLPEGSSRRIERFWHEPKVAVEVASFADRIESEPQPLRHLVVGQRELGRVARLDRLPRRAALRTVFRQGVLGEGVYQGVGYAHQRGVREVVAKLPVGLRRARADAAGLKRADVWRLTLGQDHERNWEALLPLLD